MSISAGHAPVKQLTRMISGRPGPTSARLSDLGLLEEERSAVVLAVLDRLPKRDRWMIRARFIFGFTYDEIGKQLGVGRARVGQLVARALRRLRGFIAEQVGQT